MVIWCSGIFILVCSIALDYAPIYDFLFILFFFTFFFKLEFGFGNFLDGRGLIRSDD